MKNESIGEQLRKLKSPSREEELDLEYESAPSHAEDPTFEEKDLLFKLKSLTKKTANLAPNKNWSRVVPAQETILIKAKITGPHAESFKRILPPEGVKTAKFGDTRKLKLLIDHYENTKKSSDRQINQLKQAIASYVQRIVSSDLSASYKEIEESILKIRFVYQILGYDLTYLTKLLSTQESTHLLHCLKLASSIDSGCDLSTTIEGMITGLHDRINAVSRLQGIR